MSHAIRFSYWKRGKFGCRRRLGGEESIVAASGPHRAEERELERTNGVFVQLILRFSSASPISFQQGTFPSLRAHVRPCTLPHSTLTDFSSLVLLLVDCVPTMTFEASQCLQNFNFSLLARGKFPFANSVNIIGSS